MNKRYIFLILFALISTASSLFACDKCSFTLVSEVANPDGSITYTLNLDLDQGGLDPSFYGYTLTFNAPTGASTPVVMMGTGIATTSSIAQANITGAANFGSDQLTGLIGANIGSVGGTPFTGNTGKTNVISYEYGGVFSLTSGDFVTQVQVTVSGCVESIDWNANLSAGSVASPGCGYTVNTTLCSVCGLTAGTQTNCDPATNTYTQQVTVNYTNPPASGTLDVNGQSFPVTASPQTVTLTGLSANGATVNATANFSASGSCTFTANSLFTAPTACAAVSCAITAVAAGTQTACDPATNTYTQAVVVTYSNAPATGTLNVNGQTFAITASPQTVVLTGLPANALGVNATAVFSADAACTNTVNTLFTAPAACSTSCTPDNGTWD